VNENNPTSMGGVFDLICDGNQSNGGVDSCDE
jgi:hypothetical protein